MLLCATFQVGAQEIPSEKDLLTTEDLADQVAEVLDFFGLDEVIGMGVTGGAYILSLFAVCLSTKSSRPSMSGKSFFKSFSCNSLTFSFSGVIETYESVLGAVQCKYADRALGLILVSPLAQSTSWTEWLTNQAMINLLYFCGMTGFVKERLLQRYFSSDVRDTAESTGADVLLTIRQVSKPTHSDYTCEIEERSMEIVSGV